MYKRIQQDLRQEPVLRTPLVGIAGGEQRSTDGTLRTVLLDGTADRQISSGTDGGDTTKNLEVHRSTISSSSLREWLTYLYALYQRLRRPQWNKSPGSGLSSSTATTQNGRTALRSRPSRAVL